MSILITKSECVLMCNGVVLNVPINDADFYFHLRWFHTLWAKIVNVTDLMEVGRNTLQGIRYRYPGFIWWNHKNSDVAAPPSERAENP